MSSGCAKCAEHVLRIAQLESQVEALQKSKRKTDKMLFQANFTLANKKQNQKFTINRRELRLKETLVMFKELVNWMEDVLGEAFDATDKERYREDFLSLIDSGVVLCRVLFKLFPTLCTDKVAKQLHTKAKSGSFLAHDNISLFLQLLSDPLVGAPSHSLFVSQDVLAPADLGRKVCICLFALATVAHEKVGVALPRMLRLEQLLLTPSSSSSSSSSSPDQKQAATMTASASGGFLQTEQDKRLLEEKIEQSNGKLVMVNDDGLVAFTSCRSGIRTETQAVILHGNVMFRFNNEWIHIERFITQCCGASLSSSSSSSTSAAAAASSSTQDKKQQQEQEEKVATTQTSSSKVAFSDSPVVVIQRRKPTAATTTDSPVPTEAEDDGKEESPEDAAHRQEMEARKEFFYLTVLAIKMNHELADEVLCVSPDDLFEKAINDHIEFFQFHDWIHKNLTMLYLENVSTQRLENTEISSAAKRLSVMSSTTGGDSLRSQRRSVMANLVKRREKMKKST